MATPSSIADSVTNTPAGPSGVHGLGDTFAADPHSGTGRFDTLEECGKLETGCDRVEVLL